MNKRNYNDFTMATIAVDTARHEPFDKLRRAVAKGIFIFLQEGQGIKKKQRERCDSGLKCFFAGNSQEKLPIFCKYD